MLKSIVGGLIGTLLSLSPLIAQAEGQPFSHLILAQIPTLRGESESVSPLELQQFIQALKQLKRVEMETQEKMIEALKSERLSPQRFQEIGQQQSNPDATSTQISPNEQQQFEKALTKIQTIQQEAIPKQSRAVTFQGLTMQRFNQIGRAIEKNPTLKQQLQSNFR